MKSQKSLWEILPHHYWTGILGGVIWLIWLAVALFLQSHWHYNGRSLLTWIVFYMLLTPIDLSGFFSDILIAQALENANGGSVYTIPYHYAGYTILFIIFVVVGIVVGRTSNDPEREARRKRMLKVLLGIVLFLWVCWACTLPILYAWWS